MKNEKSYIVLLSSVLLIVAYLGFSNWNELNHQKDKVDQLVIVKVNENELLSQQVEDLNNEYKDLEDALKNLGSKNELLNHTIIELNEKISNDNQEITEMIDNYEKEYFLEHPEALNVMNMTTSNTHIYKSNVDGSYIKYCKGEDAWLSMITEVETAIDEDKSLMHYIFFDGYWAAKFTYEGLVSKYIDYRGKSYIDISYNATPFSNVQKRTGYVIVDDLFWSLRNDDFEQKYTVLINIKNPDINDEVESELFKEMINSKFTDGGVVSVGKSKVMYNDNKSIDMYEVKEWQENDGVLEMDVIVRYRKMEGQPEKSIEDRIRVTYDGENLKWGELTFERVVD